MRYLITGHTGFKGSWLTVLLKLQGHEVYGISLEANTQSLFNQANIEKSLDGNYIVDIRNSDELTQKVLQINPQVIIHLAAQPLVRYSYDFPVQTYETNVLGTLHLLESTRKLSDLKATLIITTDKVYKNKNKISGYLEEDELGGDDPYSASKAAADILTQSWRTSFGDSPIAIARSGNVIGGGDFAEGRIITDLVNAINKNTSIKLRHMDSVRPWQHVLDCLNGYVLLVNSMISNGTQGEWNFSPKTTNINTVGQVTNEFLKAWGKDLPKIETPSDFKETHYLMLDSSKSRKFLEWNEKLDFKQLIKWTVDWHKAIDKPQFTERQVKEYLNL